jgi:dTDP-glucose pyrophosphorylase
MPRYGNWLTTTQLAGDHWSFAQIDNGLVVETIEKKRISSNASVGLYGFQDAITFRMAIESKNIENSSTEIYVAPLYNELIHLGLQVRLHEIEADCFVSAGTPEEIVKCCALFDWTMPLEIKDAQS